MREHGAQKVRPSGRRGGVKILMGSWFSKIMLVLGIIAIYVDPVRGAHHRVRRRLSHSENALKVGLTKHLKKPDQTQENMMKDCCTLDKDYQDKFKEVAR